MATKGNGKDKIKKAQLEQARHAAAYGKHESDLAESIVEAHVKASTDKAAAARKSASQVKALMKAAIENKKSTAEVMLAAAEGFSEVAAIERSEAQKVAALQKKLTAAKAANVKQESADNLLAIQALTDELEEVKESFAVKADKVLRSLKAVEAKEATAKKIMGTRIGKQLAEQLQKDKIEDFKSREDDFLKNRRETINALQAKMKIAEVSGNAELSSLLKDQLAKTRERSVADFEELQKRIDRQLENSDEATQEAFKTAEKMAAKRGLVNSRIDKLRDAKDSLTLSNLAKATVGKLGFGEGRTLNDLNATRRAKAQIRISDKYAASREAASKAKDLEELRSEHPDAFAQDNIFAGLKESARIGSEGDSEIKEAREENDRQDEIKELKGINKALGKLSDSGSGGGGVVNGLLSALTGGIGALLGGLGKMLFKGSGKAGEKALAKTGEKALEKGGEKTVEKAAEKIGEKSIAKLGEKSLGKTILKKIPGIGLGLGAYFAAERIGEGDFLGAAGELASGVVSLVPGYGTALSIGIDAGLAGRDLYRAGGSDENSSTVAATAKPPPPPTRVAQTAAPRKVSGAGGGRGNAQSQMAAVTANGGSDGKATSVGGIGSGDLMSLVTTTGNVNLDDLTPGAKNNLLGLARDYNSATGKKLRINSAVRSYAKQAKLYADYKAGKPGANPANPPGSSLHEVGLAIDIAPDQVDEMDKLGLVSKNGFERIAGSRERQHIQLAGAQKAISGGASGMVSGDTLGAGTAATLSANESFVGAGAGSSSGVTQNGQISVSAASEVSGGSGGGASTSRGGASQGGSGGGGSANRGPAISVTSIPTFMFTDPAFYATNVQAMA